MHGHTLAAASLSRSMPSFPDSRSGSGGHFSEGGAQGRPQMDWDWTGSAMDAGDLEAEPIDADPDDDDLRLLEPQEVRRLIWEQVPLVDARTGREYERLHLPRALHLPHDASLLRLRTVLPDLGQPLITYSNGQGRSTALARRLMARDYRNVYLLSGGIGLLLALQDT